MMHWTYRFILNYLDGMCSQDGLAGTDSRMQGFRLGSMGFEIYSPCVPRYVHPPVSVVHARLGIERMVWDFFTCHLKRL